MRDGSSRSDDKIDEACADPQRFRPDRTRSHSSGDLKPLRDDVAISQAQVRARARKKFHRLVGWYFNDAVGVALALLDLQEGEPDVVANLRAPVRVPRQARRPGQDSVARRPRHVPVSSAWSVGVSYGPGQRAMHANQIVSMYSASAAPGYIRRATPISLSCLVVRRCPSVSLNDLSYTQLQKHRFAIAGANWSVALEHHRGPAQGTEEAGKTSCCNDKSRNATSRCRCRQLQQCGLC